MKRTLIILLVLAFLLAGTIGVGTASAAPSAAFQTQKAAAVSNGPPVKNHKTYLQITRSERVYHKDLRASLVADYEFLVVEGYLKEQRGNTPQKNDPGVPNAPVQFVEKLILHPHRGEYPSPYSTNVRVRQDVRTAWWDDSGWFKFDVAIDSGGVFYGYEMQYQVKFPGMQGEQVIPGHGGLILPSDDYYLPSETGWTVLYAPDSRYFGPV